MFRKYLGGIWEVSGGSGGHGRRHLGAQVAMRGQESSERERKSCTPLSQNGGAPRGHGKNHDRHCVFEEMLQKHRVFLCFEREPPLAGSDSTPPALYQIRQNPYSRELFGEKAASKS